MMAPSPEAQSLLNQLVDKYEASSAFVRGRATARRVQLNVTDAVVPGYVSGWLDPDSRHIFHTVLQNWSAQGIVELQWVQFEQGNLLNRVYLQWDGVDTAYALLKRTRRGDELAALLQELVDFETRIRGLLPKATLGADSTGSAESSTSGSGIRQLCVEEKVRAMADTNAVVVEAGVPPWVSRWLEDIRNYVRDKRKIPSQLVPLERDKRAFLLSAIYGLLHKGEEALGKRLFSRRYLGGSKVFEQQVVGKFVGLLRRYWLPEYAYVQRRDPAVLRESFVEDDLLLAEVGIEVSHDDVTFGGPLVAKLPQGQVLDCRSFRYGLALDTAAVDAMTVVDLPVRRILSIENKANYRHYVQYERQPDELVVYLAGFASPAMRRFLRKLHAFLIPATEGDVEGPKSADSPLPRLEHWGDLDYGGILILQGLRDSVWPEALPWRMEPEWLEEYEPYLETFAEDYRHKLMNLLQQDTYGWAHPLIRGLLRVGGTLEQEVFLV